MMDKEEKAQDDFRVVAISRGCEFSPNHIEKDAAILAEVLSCLERKGIKTSVVSEEEYVNESIEADFIYNMARGRRTIERLKEVEKSGVTVVNSAFGIERCRRSQMTRLLLENMISCPKSAIVSTEARYKQTFFPCWIKRGDSHAMLIRDVSYVGDQKELEDVFVDFRSRGIDKAVISEHLQGDLIKFYGVADTGFFYWFYPLSSSHNNMKHDNKGNTPAGYDFSIEDLKKYGARAAQVLNVAIYGGDCIVSEKGEIRIIDFNDWPSFAPCREKAGVKIAEYILQKIKEVGNTK